MERLTLTWGRCGAIALVAFVAFAAGCGQARTTRFTLGDALDVTVTSYAGEDGRTLYQVVARHGNADGARARACRARETQLAFAFRGHRPTGLRVHDTHGFCDV